MKIKFLRNNDINKIQTMQSFHQNVTEPAINFMRYVLNDLVPQLAILSFNSAFIFSLHFLSTVARESIFLFD